MLWVTTMKKTILPALIAVVLTLSLSWPVHGQGGESSSIRINEPFTPLTEYMVDAVKLALSRIDHSYQIEMIPGDLTQTRNIEMVSNGQLDIMSAATNDEMEQLLQPVRIPLMKGLLGYRVMIIGKGNQSYFDQIDTFDDLKKVSMGQGTRWADTQILEHNGLNVVKVNKFPSLFYMVDGGRFDAFPRGVNEPFAEVEQWGKEGLQLAVEQRLMLMYRMPFYIYTSKNRPQLAADLERGLNLAIADGGFDKLFFGSEMVQDVLQKANMAERKVFPLDNPTLPEATPVDRPELWLDVSDL